MNKINRIMVKKNFIKMTSIIDSLLIVYMISISIFSYSIDTIIYSRIANLLLLFMLCIYSLSKNKVFINLFFINFSIFVIFCFFSYFWAYDKNDVIKQSFTLFQLLFLYTLLFSYLKNEKKVKFLLWAIFINGLIFAFYVLYYYGINNYIQGLLMGIRMGTEIANVNTIGVTTAISAIIGIYYFLEKRKIIYLISFFLCVLVAFGTGSRKVIILLFFGVFLLLFLRINKKTFLRSILGIVLISLFLYILLQRPEFSTLNKRFSLLLNIFSDKTEIDYSTWLRMKMIEYGLQEFWKQPIIGIGIGNTHYITMKYMSNLDSYLHNNYIELLASVGIVGTSMFYSLYIFPLIKFFPFLRKKDTLVIIATVILLLQLVLQYGMVSYYSKETYLYLVFAFLVCDYIKQKK